MRSFFFVLMACAFFSCSNTTEEVQQDDEDDYFEIGTGTDPVLNIYEYSFSNAGDSISVYSIKGNYGLQVITSKGMYTGQLFYSDSGYSRGYYGDWWYAACPDTKPEGSRIDIVVQPNDTGEEREIPVSVFYYDWGGGKFVQEK